MTRLPKGLSQTSKGWRISVRVHGQLWQKRFPPSTPQSDVEDALLKAKKRLSATSPTGVPGTLGGDIRRYLADYYTGKPGYAERARHLALWKEALGKEIIWRSRITRDDIARILNQWRAAGLAADTCNKRRTALLALYHALDGKGGSNPVREIPKFRSPDPLPRGLSYGLIEKALRKLPKSKTQARLRLMAYTGLRHSQIMRLTPACWNTRARTLLAPGTSKGRGTKPYVIPLSDRATKALQAFDALDAWGTFTWAPMARMWKEAAKAAKLPEGTVPYDLRHSFGTAIYKATGDLKVTKELMGHSALRMTERYTLAAVPARNKHAISETFG